MAISIFFHVTAESVIISVTNSIDIQGTQTKFEDPKKHARKPIDDLHGRRCILYSYSNNNNKST